MRRFAAALALLLAPLPAHAAPALDGAQLGWPWARPCAVPLPVLGLLTLLSAGEP